MPRAGLAFRQAAALDAAAARPCPNGCGHPSGAHFELKPTWELGEEDGKPTLVEVPHPEYKPFHFHCQHEGCSCIIDRTGG
jgi:hypothetical protein